MNKKYSQEDIDDIADIYSSEPPSQIAEYVDYILVTILVLIMIGTIIYGTINYK